MSSEAETSLNIQKLLDPSRADNRAVPCSMFTAQSGFNRPLSSETFREQAADPPGAISGS